MVKKHRYDLPIIEDSFSKFQVILLITLTTLTCWILSAVLFANTQSNKWINGIESSFSIEIPVFDKQQKERSSNELNNIAAKIENTLKRNAYVQKTEIIPRETLTNITKETLGSFADSEEIPYPVLIKVETKEKSSKKLNEIKTNLKKIDKNIGFIETKDMLSSLLSLYQKTKYAGGLIVACLFFVSFIIIAFLVKARMRMLSNEVEILHLMGSTPSFISNQFSRQAFVLSLKGSFIGFFLSVLSMLIIETLFMNNSLAAFSNHTLMNVPTLLILITLPVVFSLTSTFMAHLTANKMIKEMP